MFMEASSAPTASPKTPSATATCHTSRPAPTPSRANRTRGWDHRRTTPGRTRATTFSVATLPAPARIGTAARKTGSSPSDIPYWS